MGRRNLLLRFQNLNFHLISRGTQSDTFSHSGLGLFQPVLKVGSGCGKYSFALLKQQGPEKQIGHHLAQGKHVYIGLGSGKVAFQFALTAQVWVRTAVPDALGYIHRQTVLIFGDFRKIAAGKTERQAEHITLPRCLCAKLYTWQVVAAHVL
jgi:hypothetical protein